MQTHTHTYLFPGRKRTLWPSLTTCFSSIRRFFAAPPESGGGYGARVWWVGQRIQVKDSGDETVKSDGQKQRDNVEDGEVDKVNGQIEVSRDAVTTLNTTIRVHLDVHQEEPEHTVDTGENPHPGNDAFGSGYRTDGMSPHWVTYGDVSVEQRDNSNVYYLMINPRVGLFLF